MATGLVDVEDGSALYRRVLDIAKDTVRNLYAASRGKTGDPKCSEAVSAWVRKKATPETHQQLAKCRAMARVGGKAAKLRNAGQEAKAQHLEHRLKSGEPLTIAERRAKAKSLVAERASKAKPAAAEPKADEWKDNPYFEHGRRYRAMADAVYEGRRPMSSGADRTDAVRHDMVAKAFGRLGQGEDVESVIGKLKSEWNEFAEQKKKQIEAAPKIRRGPSSGHSIIGHEHADPGAMDSHEIFIRNIAKQVGPVGGKAEEKPAEPHKVPAIPSIDDVLARRSEAQIEARQQIQKAADAKKIAELEERKRKNDELVAQDEAATRRGIKPFERGSRIRAAQAVKKLPHGERAAKLAAIQENMGSAESLHGKKQKPLPDRLDAIRARKSPEVSGAMATIKAAGTPANTLEETRAKAEAASRRGFAEHVPSDRKTIAQVLKDTPKEKRAEERHRRGQESYRRSGKHITGTTKTFSERMEGRQESKILHGVSPSGETWAQVAEKNLLESPSRPGEFQDKAGIAHSIYNGRDAAIKAIAKAHHRANEERQRLLKQQQAERDRIAKRARSRKLVGMHVEGGKLPAQTKYRQAAMKSSAEGTKGFKKGTVSLTLREGKVDIPAHIKGNLAVHETYDPYVGKRSKTYRVTNVETGLGIGGVLDSLGRAKEIAHAIHRRGIDVGQVKEHLGSKDPVQRELAGKQLKFIKSLFGRTG